MTSTLSSVTDAIPDVEFDRYEMTMRKMQVATTLIQVSECLRLRRFPATVSMIREDLQERFGVVVCTRTVQRYLRLLDVFGVAEEFPPDGDFPTTWAWNRGIGLLAVLDRESTDSD